MTEPAAPSDTPEELATILESGEATKYDCWQAAGRLRELARELDAWTIVHKLIIEDVVFFGASSGLPFVICNDVFAWASADGEGLPLDQAAVVADLYQRFGDAGPVAWVAARRGTEPMREYLRVTPNYAAALAAVDKTGGE